MCPGVETAEGGKGGVAPAHLRSFTSTAVTGAQEAKHVAPDGGGVSRGPPESAPRVPLLEGRACL